MEKVIFSDYVKMDPTDNALKVLSDLQRRYPASALVNLFYLKLHTLTAEFIQFRRHGIKLGLNKGAGFIHHVYGFIRQEPV